MSKANPFAVIGTFGLLGVAAYSLSTECGASFYIRDHVKSEDTNKDGRVERFFDFDGERFYSVIDGESLKEKLEPTTQPYRN